MPQVVTVAQDQRVTWRFAKSKCSEVGVLRGDEYKHFDYYWSLN